MITMEDIRQLSQNREAITWTAHVAMRLIKRKITPAEVIQALREGSIIEQYPTDYPYPSCLVFAVVVNSRPLHVVCSIGDEQLFVITAYQPSADRWDKTFTHRKD